MSFGAVAGGLAAGIGGSVVSGMFGGDGGFGGDMPQLPPPPDYIGAAKETAAGNLLNARDATNANRPTQTNPFGSVKWTRDKDGNWTQSTNWSPAQLKLLYSQQNASNTMAGALGKYLRTARGTSAGDAGKVGYDALMARYQPQMQQSRAALENQLANQGVMPGSEAYNNAMRTQQQGENDLMSQAGMYGQQTGMAMQRNAMDMLSAAREQAAPTAPQFGGFALQQTTPGPDILGATDALGRYNQGMYNGQVGQYNANGGALGPFGSAAVSLGSNYLAGGGKLPSFGGLFGGGGASGGSSGIGGWALGGY